MEFEFHSLIHSFNIYYTLHTLDLEDSEKQKKKTNKQTI